jgi:hypothetical protein
MIFNWISRNKPWISLLLLIIPAIIVLLFIFLFGRTVIFTDEWIMVPIIDHSFNGTIPWQDLFTQFNVHLAFFPKLAITGIALMTGFNTVAEMYFSWLILVLISVLIYTLCVRYFGDSVNTRILFIPIAWLLWSLRQWENFLLGFEINFFLCVLGFVISVVLIDRSQDFRLSFLGALGGAVITSFSTINGLLIWPIGIILIILQRKGKKMLLSWVLCAISINSLYILNWKDPGNGGAGGLTPIAFFTNNPATVIKFFLAFLGSPLSPGQPVNIIILYSILVGIFVLVAIVVGIALTLKYHLLKENSPWIALLLFYLGTAFMTTIVRSCFGTGQALTSRYVTFSILGIIGLYFLYVTIYKYNGPDLFHSGWMLKGVTCIILFGVFLGLIEGMAMGMRIASDRDKMTCTLMNYPSASDQDLSAIYPDPNFVREMAIVLEKRHLNVFSGPDDIQQNMNCTTTGVSPDLYNRLFDYKEKMLQLI